MQVYPAKGGISEAKLAGGRAGGEARLRGAEARVVGQEARRPRAALGRASAEARQSGLQAQIVYRTRGCSEVPIPADERGWQLSAVRLAAHEWSRIGTNGTKAECIEMQAARSRIVRNEAVRMTHPFVQCGALSHSGTQACSPWRMSRPAVARIPFEKIRADSWAIADGRLNRPGQGQTCLRNSFPMATWTS